MAKVVIRLCTCLCIFSLISCGNGVHLTDLVTDGNYYKYNDYSVLHNSDIVAQINQERRIFRAKRYLTGEFDDVNVGRTFLAVSGQDSLLENSKASLGSSGTAVTNTTRNETIEKEATRIPTIPFHVNEHKTGGNYLSVKNASMDMDLKNESVSNKFGMDIPKPMDANVAVVPTPPENATRNISSPTPTEKEFPNVTGDHITIGNVLDKVFLSAHNITKSLQDSHVYYNSSFISNDEKLGKFYWVDMNNNSLVQTNDMLSQSHRRAVTVKLSFDFPFYGHTVRNVTIATGGFLYTGDYVHSWLAATQYIAPLMANFDTSLSNESFVKYVDNGTQFTVQWDKVKLQDRPESGVFTFQATLRKTGDIIFVYQCVPVVISNITDDNHPVKVGLSDAYIIDRNVLFVRRKTIYEYHRITFEHLSISNWTVITLNPLPTCLEGTDCESCLSRKVGFECFWCPETKRCSNGIDRNRQEWLKNDCDRQSISNVSLCPVTKNVAEVERKSTSSPSTPELEAQTESSVTALLTNESSSVNVSALIGILFCVGALLTLSFWALYAYRNPHTTSGQFLIKYRPSQWSWRRGEARYTAATIHM